MNSRTQRKSLEGLDARERLAARREQRENPQKIELTKKQLAGYALLAAGATIALLKGGEVVYDRINGPDISETTTTHVVIPGDTLDRIVLENVEGAENVDRRAVTHEIRNNPANAEVFENNQLDPGEVLTIPESVED